MADPWQKGENISSISLISNQKQALTYYIGYFIAATQATIMIRFYKRIRAESLVSIYYFYYSAIDCTGGRLDAPFI